jgi:ABC-2 type transport system ATP-binding protein
MIEVLNLSKSFGHKLAVDNLTFSVGRGEVLGFLGPNGAGKSTTMRMITGFLPPTSGRVSVGGNDIVENPLAAKRLIGYLPENAPSYTDMTVHGFLSFTAEMRGLSGAEKQRAIARAAELTFLQPVLQQSVDTLSKGYRHRTCFAQAIIHDPQVLILDEPTDGLDPNQKREVRGLIRRMGETKAIIFSTHILEEVEAACTRAIIIDRGRIVANGTPDELKRMAQNAGAVRLVLRGVPASAAKARLSALPGVVAVEVLSDGDPVALRVSDAAKGGGGALAAAVYGAARDAGWSVMDLHSDEGRLDEVFHSITLPDVHANKEAA